MKKYGLFISIALLTSLLALHILLAMVILTPTVSVTLPVIIVGGLVAGIGIVRLGWSAATPTIQPRKKPIDANVAWALS